MVRLAYDMTKDPNLRINFKTDFMLFLAHKMLTHFINVPKPELNSTIVKIFRVPLTMPK